MRLLVQDIHESVQVAADTARLLSTVKQLANPPVDHWRHLSSVYRSVTKLPASDTSMSVSQPASAPWLPPPSALLSEPPPTTLAQMSDKVQGACDTRGLNLQLVKPAAVVSAEQQLANHSEAFRVQYPSISAAVVVLLLSSAALLLTADSRLRSELLRAACAVKTPAPSARFCCDRKTRRGQYLSCRDRQCSARLAP